MSDLIDRQAAIDAITEIDEGFNCDIYTNEVREILRELPSVQPVEDIYREKEQAYYCGYEDGAKVTRSELPTVQVRKKGRWIHKVRRFATHWSCSVCDNMWFFDCSTWAFCPKCGARMEGAEDDPEERTDT